MNWFKRQMQGWGAQLFFKASDKFGPENLGGLVDALEEVDEYSSDYLQLNKDLGGCLWVYLVAISLLLVGMTYFLSWQGFLSGVFLSISILVIARTVHCAIREASVHPGGISGYNYSQSNLKKHAHLGSRFHNILRKYLMYKWYYFLYVESGERWSYRPYILILFLCALFYWFPLLGFSFSSLFVSAFVFVASSTNMPIAFYMGSSSKESHILFKKIRRVSGIKWVSLLHDEHSITDSPTSVEDQLSLMRVMVMTNIWSLRLESDDNWLTIVKDFIDFSGIVVIKADKVDAVRQELDYLACSHALSRVIVIGDLASGDVAIPKQLHKYLMSEEEALNMLSLAYVNPKVFREKMSGRL